MSDNTLGTALISLSKLMRALGYYPAGHPALDALAREAEIQWRVLLQHGEVSFSVTRTGFSVNGSPVDSANTTLQSLAQSCHERRMATLTVSPGVREKDLLCLSAAILMKPEELHLRGGFGKYLETEEADHITISDIQIQPLDPKSKTPSPKKPAVPTPKKPGGPKAAAAARPKPDPRKRRLKELLVEIRKAKPTQLPELMKELKSVAPPVLADLPLKGSLAVFPLLSQFLRHPRLAPEVRQAVDQTSTHLASPELLIALLEAVEDPELETAHCRVLSDLFQRYGDQVLEELLESWRTAAPTRDRILPALQQLRDRIVPFLEESLAKTRGVPVGDIQLMGELGGPEQVPCLHPLLISPLPDLRAAAFRAVTAIGGQEVTDHLLELARQRGSNGQLQAIAALGQLQTTEAIPTLTKTALQPDPFKHHTDERLAAVKALGGINSSEVVPKLIQLLRKRGFLFKTPVLIRAAAATALGRWNQPEVLSALKRARGDKEAQVRQAATSALQRMGEEG